MVCWGLAIVLRGRPWGYGAGIAAPDPAFFQHRDIGEAVVLGQIVGSGQAMAAAADDNGVIFGFRLRIAPGQFPAAIAR